MRTIILKSVASILLLMALTNVYAGNTKILLKGKVTEEGSNNPIAGVSVSLRGGSAVTQTNIAGLYAVQVIKGATLEFKHPAYETRLIVVTAATLHVSLKKKIVAENRKISNKSKETVLSTIAYSPPVVRCEEAIAGYDKSYQFQAASSNFAYASPVMNEPNTEEYSAFAENRFKNPKTDPLSTFSLDVDAASYSNIRRMINSGQFPDKNSVRVEEMLNYFSYNYAQPTGKDPVKINTEVHACPWNSNHLLARIGVKAREIPSANLPASNFVFLLDVSGSMSATNKLPLVKSSIKLLTNNMRSKDRIAIVVYAGAAGVVLESTSGEDVQKINEAIERLSAGGSTAGGAGIELAYKIAQKNFIQGGNNRIILCTDGDFNVGISDEGGLERLIEAKRKTGVFLTVLGYGMGNYKDNKLQILSQKGNGNHAYIDNIQEANKVLVNEFGSTMYAVAKDVKLQVEFNPAVVSSYRLVGYETRLLNKEDFNNDAKDAGELGAGHTVTALYEIVLTGAATNYKSVDDLRYQPTIYEAPDMEEIVTDNAEMMYVKLRYKPINSDTSIKMEVAVSNNIKQGTASVDYLFAASTAMFAQLLKDSEFKGEASYEDVIAYANKGVGNDTRGYRREFVRLVEAVNQMAK